MGRHRTRGTAAIAVLILASLTPSEARSATAESGTAAADRVPPHLERDPLARSLLTAPEPVDPVRLSSGIPVSPIARMQRQSEPQPLRARDVLPRPGSNRGAPPSAPTRTPVWSAQSDGDPASWEFTSDATSGGGRFFTSGISTGADSNFDALTTAYDVMTGDLHWRARFDGPGSDYDTILGVVASDDGSTVFVSGYTWTGRDFDVLTLAYDGASGAERWRAIRDTAGGDEGAFALALSPDGSRLFVAGIQYVGARAQGSSVRAAGAMLLLAYDTASGRELWRGVTAGSDLEGALSVAVSSDGARVVAAGLTQLARAETDTIAVAFDAATGVQLWRSVSGERGYDVGYAVRTQGGSAYVVGSGIGASDDFRTSALDIVTGVQHWVQRYDAARDFDAAYLVAVAADGSTVYASGFSGTSFAAYDYATVGYDAITGAQRWVHRYHAGGPDLPGAIGVAPSGDVVVTGRSNARDGHGYDIATVVIDPATGAQRSVSRIDEGPNDGGVGLALDIDAILIAADSWGGRTLVDHLALRLGDDGWESRYDGPGRYGLDATFESVTSRDGSTVFHAGVAHDNGVRITTRALDAQTGALRWQTSFDPLTNADPSEVFDAPSSIAVDPSGERVFVTGVIVVMESESRYDVLSVRPATVAYDAQTGAELWRTTGVTPEITFGYGTHVVTSPDGSRVYVASDRKGVGDPFQTVIDAHDAATGTLLWTTRMGAGDERTGGLAISPDGRRVFVGGRHWSGVRGTRYRFAVRALDTSDGSVEWTALHGGAGGFLETAVAGISATSDGRVLLAGNFGDDGSFPDIVAVSFDAVTGAEQWTSSFDDGNSYDETVDATLHGSTLYLTGRLIGSTALATGHLARGNDVVTLALDTATGARRWVQIFDSGGASSPEDLPWDIDVAGDAVTIAGMTFDVLARWNELTLAYDATTGARAWTVIRDGPSPEDVAYTVSASPDGARVFVGGVTRSPETWFDTVAHAYDH